MFTARRRRLPVQLVAGTLCAMLVASVAGASGSPAPAADPATPTPDAVGTTVDLGRYALNGAVRAAVRDPATGTTWLGGEFSRIGLRTGGVAVVGAPDAEGDLETGAPEVLGNVQAVFADDRPNDPGVFVVGRIGAINGSAVSQNSPVHRLHRVSGSWVRDTSWTVSGECNVGNIQFPMDMQWIATDTYLIGGSQAGADSWMGSLTGIVLVNRSTGVLKTLGTSGCSASALLPSIGNLPTLNGCSRERRCEAYVGRLGWDPTSKRLLVSYLYVEGGDTEYVMGEGVAAYDLTPSTGGRVWHRWVQAGPPGSGYQGTVQTIMGLPGRFLLFGSFPLAGDSSDATFGRRLLLDASTGALLGRWNSLGEQDPVTGDVLNGASVCLTEHEQHTARPARIGATGYMWTNVRTHLCSYAIGPDGVEANVVASAPEDIRADRLAPSIPYTAGDGTTYLVGSRTAVDLGTGAMTSWNPDPAMNPNAAVPSVAVAGGSVVIGGDFRFLRGTAMAGVAALDAALAPVSGFQSPFTNPVDGWGVRAMAMHDGRLLVGGSTGWTDGTLAVLDPATGAVAWSPSLTLLTVDAVAFDAAGGIWAGGTASPVVAPDKPLLHWAPPEAGGAAMDSPSFGCLDLNAGDWGWPDCTAPWRGQTTVGAILAEPDGSVTVAGLFGSVDGTPRRALARFDAAGALTAWDPDLPGALGIGKNTLVKRFEALSLAVVGDQVVLGGRFNWDRVVTAGDLLWEEVPLVILSRTTGAIVRPSGPEYAAWIDPKGWWFAGYDLLPTDGGLVVAFGEAGMGIVDATTFDLDEVSSAPFLDPNWLTPIVGNGIYALAHPADEAVPPAETMGFADSFTAAAATSPLVLAGTINRWKNRVAGNVARTTVAPDTTPPVVSAVRAAPKTGSVASGGSARLRVGWAAADPHGSGAGSYDVGWSVAGGAWQTIATDVPTRGYDVTVRSGTTYRFRVRARDNAGNLGAWTAGPTIRAALVQQTASAVRFSSGWDTVKGDGYSGGSARRRSAAGATASFTFTGRGVGFVSTLASTRGRVSVYVDGHYVQSLDLRSTTARYRTVAWSRAWTTSAKHVVKLVVRGTTGRPRIDVDAFVVIR